MPVVAPPPPITCRAGAFAARQGMYGTCPACPAGSFTADAGNSVCDVCNPGFYQDVVGQTSCKACPEGTYNEFAGSNAQAACLPAPKGNYAPGTGNDGYVPCDPGYYQDTVGQGSCKVCVWSPAPPAGARGFHWVAVAAVQGVGPPG